jgi:predicted GH43/DUF377 family glycosyl hydrolase
MNNRILLLFMIATIAVNFTNYKFYDKLKNSLTFLFLILSASLFAQNAIEQEVMRKVYEEVKTPYKYGLLLAPTDNNHKIDCPTVFRKNGRWYMSYLVYDGKKGNDGRGYETWLAESEDLLHWTTLGKILAFPDDETWDQNQRAGYFALIDNEWGGSYEPQKFKDKYWMSYFGGQGKGYESGRLEIGIACTDKDITKPHNWQTSQRPVLSPLDKDCGWWENITQYKSFVFKDEKKTFGKQFVLFYNAGGINPENNIKAERIGIALSDDMLHWKRYSGNPVINHEQGITGDGVIQKMGELYVMFYFGAFHKNRPYKAFNTFACSRDLIHWTDWTGDDLIFPTEKYDNLFAHKSCVIKHNGVVYHFYCAVNDDDQRGIALATSKNMGKSRIRFPKPDKETFRKEISLNNNWKSMAYDDNSAFVGFESPNFDDSQWIAVDVPHNWDKYEGARRLKHGNRHGSAAYRRTFSVENQGVGKRYFLFFEGVGSYATVFVNNKKVGYHAGGRTSFTIDITDAVQFPENNTLAVLAEHPSMITDLPWVCGGCSAEYGFSEGSQPMGIFRPVTLIITDAIRIEPFGIHAWNQSPTIADNDTTFILNVNSEIKNYGKQKRVFELIQKLTDKDGIQIERITDTVSLEAGKTLIINQKSKPLAGLHLWNTTDPYLYKLITMVKENGKVIDQETTNYGFRWISFPLSRSDGDKRFYLNGKPLFINGVCEYEHLLGNSHAFSEEQIVSRVNQIKQAGFNAFRDAHQPHNLLYSQLWEKTGTLLWTQFSAHIWYDTPEFRENFKTTLREWVKERRNSPSVVLWGLQNESALPEAFARECTEIIREMDPTSPSQRLVTTCNGGAGTDWNVVQNWSGTYGGNLQNYAVELSRPEQLLNGEYGAWRSIGLHSEEGLSAKENTEERMCELLETKIRLAEQAHDSVCGQFLWLYNSHDNPGRVQNNEGSREIDKTGPFNYKGLVTTWEHPVDAYYMYRANYVPKETSPMVYIVSHTWADRWTDTDKKSRITVYSNCDEVELFSGDRLNSLGNRKRNDKCAHFSWDSVEIRPETETLIAVGYVNNQEVARDEILCHPKTFDGLFKKESKFDSSLNFIYRVNCGGEDFTDSAGNLWMADVHKETGNYWGALSWTDDWDNLPDWLVSQGELYDRITRTADPQLFRTFRYGREKLRYIFPLPDGEYLIDLYFIEPWWGRDRSMDCEGFRIFDVAVSGETVIENLDIWRETGQAAVLKKTVKGKSVNGLLEISFPKTLAGQAVISAIAIYSSDKNITSAPPSPVVHRDTSAYFGIEEDVRPEITLEAENAKTNGDGWIKTVQRDREGLIASKTGEHSIIWEISPGVAGIYALRFNYMNETKATVTAKIRIFSADNRLMRDGEISFPPTSGKPKIISTTTGTTVNAGHYRVILSGNKMNGLWIDALKMQ